MRTAEAVRMGFERDGFPVVATAALAPELVDATVGLIVASATSAEAAVAALGQATRSRGDGGIDVPVLYVGNGVSRRDAMSAGADEVIGRPAFVRDVVTIGRLLAGQPAETRGHWIGQLAESVGVYYLVRALTALGRSGVLTLSRGLRRGEVRFYLGEVTSAQVGGLHGQAALHQVLLWTDGRFDFRREDVVRRRQIPLLPEELFADAERFLVSVREASGGLSPAMVLEQDQKQMQNQGRNVPTEVHGVLRMFDGNRTLADVIEDSPYRVFETMRVASMAVQAGLLRRVAVERPRTKFRAVLALEEWLAGGSKDAVAERVAALTDSSTSNPIAAPLPSGASAGGKSRRRRGANRGARAPAPAPAPPPAPAPLVPSKVEWGALVPRGVAVEMQGLSQVVPSAQASGEITIPKELDAAPATRKNTRERLESLTTELRDRIFPSEGGSATVEVGASALEPSAPPAPVLGSAEPSADAVPRPTPVSGGTPSPGDGVPRPIASTGITPFSFDVPAEAARAAEGLAGDTLRTDRIDPAELADRAPGDSIPGLPPPPSPGASSPGGPGAGDTLRGMAPMPARHEPAILVGPAPIDPGAVAERAREQAEAEEWAAKEREAKARAEATERAEAEEWARREKAAKERAEVEAAEVAARARAQTEIEAAARAAKEAEEAVAAAARARAEADERARAAQIHLEVAERMRVEMAERLRIEAERAEAEERAAREAELRAAQERARAEVEREGREQAEVDKAIQRAKEIADRMRTDAAAAAQSLATNERIRAEAEQLVAASDAADRARAATLAQERAEGTGAAVQATRAEAEARAKAEADARKAEEERRYAEDFARLEAEERAKEEAARAQAAAAEAAVRAQAAAQIEAKAAMAQAEARAVEARAAEARVEAADDTATTQPRARQASESGVIGGELGGPRRPSQPPPEVGAGPSILVEDLAAAHAAVASVAVAQTARPATADARSPQAEAQVSGVRRDASQQESSAATHFDEMEEQFFQQGASPAYGRPTEPTESFDDLDEGYQPTGFWDKLLGRDKKRGRRPPPK